VQLDLEVQLERARELVGAHLEGPVAAEPYIQHVEYDPELLRWYVRFTCDGRDATTIYFDLHERTLRYEVYFLPAPPVPRIDLYEYLLRRNHSLYGARVSLGPDGDIYLVGRVALEHLTEDELDRIIGVLYELTEQWFQPVVQLAYGKRADPAPEPAPEPGGNGPLRDGDPRA
jgi:hypothetical protein